LHLCYSFSSTRKRTVFAHHDQLGASRGAERPTPFWSLTPWAPTSVGKDDHGGDTRRIPNRLLLAYRLMNKMRRGGEVVGAQAGHAQRHLFAHLYRVTFVKGRKIVAMEPAGIIVGQNENMNMRSLVEIFLPQGGYSPVQHPAVLDPHDHIKDPTGGGICGGSCKMILPMHDGPR
jgi:hypothetical protein